MKADEAAVTRTRTTNAFDLKVAALEWRAIFGSPARERSRSAEAIAMSDAGDADDVVMRIAAARDC
jgi:hypothetical protein